MCGFFEETCSSQREPSQANCPAGDVHHQYAAPALASDHSANPRLSFISLVAASDDAPFEAQSSSTINPKAEKAASTAPSEAERRKRKCTAGACN